MERRGAVRRAGPRARADVRGELRLEVPERRSRGRSRRAQAVAAVHAPPGYDCPFCRLLRGVDTLLNAQSDIVFSDELTTALIAPKWWPANHGHVLVIPNVHYENLYEIGDTALCAVAATTKRVAIALKQAYGCGGTSTRQHNEPAGNQDVWHLHVHVFPRYAGDRLYQRHEETTWTTPEEREPYAAKLRAVLAPESDSA